MRIPNDLIVHSEVDVCDEISEARDGTPGDLWHLATHVIGDALGRFADHFEVAENGVVGSVVRDERLEVETLGEVFDLLARALDILEIQPPVTRHAVPRAPRAAVHEA
jgi:hypothetical protein